MLVQKAIPVWAVEPKNYSAAAAAPKFVSLKLYRRLTILIQTGAWAAGTAAVTLKQATDVAGTGAKVVAFAKQFNDKAVAGTLVETAVVANTFNLDTANRLFVIEVDSSALDVANGFDTISVDIASPGANADFYGVTYFVSEPRYAGATMPSPLVD